VLVEPAEPDYWPPVNREVVLTLDDILLEGGKIAPFSVTETNYAAMGRFGDVLLVSGETDLQLTAQRGEVVRLYLTDTANTRVFKVALPGARMKLVGGDSGRYEHEELVEEVVLAPSERAVVDVLFKQPGELTLEHRTPERTYSLATIVVSEAPASPSFAAEFGTLREAPELAAERERLAEYVEAEPDKTLAFVAEMDFEAPTEGPVVHTCPMHPEVVSEQPGSCPQCGMKLMPAATTYTCPMHLEVVSEEPGRCPHCGMKLLPSQLVSAAGGAHGHHEHGDAHEHADHDHAHRGHADHDHAHHEHGDHDHAETEHGHEAHGHAHAGGIEWEDDMVDVNRMTTPANTRWKIVDRATGAENHAIGWQFRVGDRVKVRLVNEMDSDHPMHHPFHVHGAGRFLILARDGEVEPNLVWSDTVLVRTGETVDILLEVTNVGRWMAHCHIAEHHESGMMFSFEVTA
jgi:FtsP/CotA-like multicopper oxidase with cupredoxin domain